LETFAVDLAVIVDLRDREGEGRHGRVSAAGIIAAFDVLAVNEDGTEPGRYMPAELPPRGRRHVAVIDPAGKVGVRTALGQGIRGLATGTAIDGEL